jgi:hypothetical protein
MRLVARQHSVFARRQWLDGGLSDRQLQRARENGAVFLIHPGVYVLRGSKSSFARAWRFRKFERPVVEILVTKGHAPKLTDVTVRRTGRLHATERTFLGVLPVASRARTLLDLATTTPHIVEGALDGVLHRRPRELQVMRQVLERAGRRHPARPLLAPILAAREAGRRPTESELEDDLLAVIRKFGLPEPEPQYPYRGRRIDFAYPDLLFGIEANSVQAHAAREDVQRNAEKANDLIEWWILYFTHDDVHGDPAGVARRIEETIARRRANVAA